MKNLLTAFLLVLVLSPIKLMAQAPEYKYQSLFMYNFTKYIQWPESAQSGDFIIGVLGNSYILAELEKVAGTKSVGNQKIIVRKVSSAAEGEKCHILFVPKSESKDFESLQNALKSKPVLVVTEKEGLCKKGSTINFIFLEGKMRFELNQNAASTAGLKISTQLVSLAVI
jgi:hypothetical protein